MACPFLRVRASSGTDRRQSIPVEEYAVAPVDPAGPNVHVRVAAVQLELVVPFPGISVEACVMAGSTRFGAR